MSERAICYYLMHEVLSIHVYVPVNGQVSLSSLKARP